MNQSSSPNRPTRGLARFAILAALVAGAPAGARRHPHRRHPLDDRPGGVARHPEEQAIKLWPGEIAGEKVRFTILNDASDTTTATKNAQRLINEDKVDLIIGASVTPTSLAVVETAGNAQVPVISLAGGGAIVAAAGRAAQVGVQALADRADLDRLVLDHLQKNGKGKSVATIGDRDELRRRLPQGVRGDRAAARLQGRRDREVQPDRPERHRAGAEDHRRQSRMRSTSSLPARPARCRRSSSAQRGYKGLVYQTQGVANNDFLRVGGKSLEGGYMTVAPVLVAEQLPESNPVKKAALDFVQRFEKAQAPNSRSLFAATAWDALLIVQHASHEALKKGKPGTPAFRAALRDAIEGLRDFVGSEGVYTMSASDHNGVDSRSQVMVRIENGGWKLQP